MFTFELSFPIFLWNVIKEQNEGEDMAIILWNISSQPQLN